MKRASRAVGLVAAVPVLLALACDGTTGTLVVRGGRGVDSGSDVDGMQGTGGASLGSGGTSPGAGGASLGSGGSATAGRSPAPGVTWQAQLSGAVDPSLDVNLFYLDADFTSAAVVSQLRAKGKLVLCYVSAGTFEPWRKDANDFPESVLGQPLADYPREQWLDVRAASVRKLMQARLVAMAMAGCDGVYPSTMEAHLHSTGFDITRSDMVAYAGWFATEIHAHGMSAGLSVSADLIPDVQQAYDWALVIDCLASGCTPWAPVRQSGRAVLQVEFGDSTDTSRVCNAAASLGFDAIIKRPAFDGFRVGCPAG